MRFNILVVDDSSVTRALIIKTLRLCELELGDIHEAADGQEALRVLGNKWIDLALVDINMPVMDGEEMIDRMRSNPATSGLPVIIVSSERSQVRIQGLIRKGVVFVQKPFTPESLGDAILRSLRGSHEQKSSFI